MNQNQSHQQRQASGQMDPAGPQQKMQLRQLAMPIKSAQDFVEGFFKERDTEGETIQQSPHWMRSTTWGLWVQLDLQSAGSL